MTSTVQPLGTRLRAVTIALALAIVVAAVVAAPSLQAKDFKVLYSFDYYGEAGDSPFGGLIFDPAGNLYGTTTEGCGGGGTVFKLDKAAKLSVLYCFNYNNGSPMTDLTRDAPGNLYGTATAYVGSGPGSVFMVDRKGKGKELYFFCSRNNSFCTDGAGPSGTLVLDAAGNLYGTTTSGGARCHPNGCGVVYKLDKAGKETVLYSFKGGKDGASPAGLIWDAKGNLYGTTGGGGAHGYGTVFKLDKADKKTTLYSFTGTEGDGAGPLSGVIRDAEGNLYGITSDGGAYGYGTAFKLDKTGKETVLHSFAGSDGQYPWAGLVRDLKGNLYGTTLEGGAFGYGTVFKLDKTGKETVLHTFSGGRRDGEYPYAVLVLDAKGNLYGTASGGGTRGGGVVFELTP